MSVGHAILTSIGVCGLAAGFEGVCAGRNVKAFFSTLTFPKYSAPLWFWSIIGGIYYLIFGFVIYRLLRLDHSGLRSATLVLIVFMMIANGLSNYVIFRARNLYLSFIIGSLFPFLDIALFICLTRLDATAAWLLMPYLIYRMYAVWWGYALWKANRALESQRVTVDSDQKGLSKSFRDFFDSEKSSGLLLIACTAISIALANSIIGPGYLRLLRTEVAGLSVEQWTNDALMAVFFLLIGLELEREFRNGELSKFRHALLPILAAIGGICVPALIHFVFNSGTTTQAGVGIPMATDIAFALGVLALLGSRVPVSLRVFLAALAVIDDLGAIIIIAVFYTAKLKFAYLAGAILVFAFLVALNRLFRVMTVVPYLLGGVVMWVLMLKSGVHATIAGVLLAFTIPFSAKADDEKSPSHRLERFLNKPVAFIVLPIFALANTGIVIGADSAQSLKTTNSLGIIAGLVLGKPAGITLICLLAVATGVCKLPPDLKWRHVFGAGLLGGIGFTMSVFITNLAFAGNEQIINASKMAVLLASLIAGAIGFLWLRSFGKPASA